MGRIFGVLKGDTLLTLQFVGYVDEAQTSVGCGIIIGSIAAPPGEYTTRFMLFPPPALAKKLHTVGGFGGALTPSSNGSPRAASTSAAVNSEQASNRLPPLIESGTHPARQARC
jgi:hypothetical protein